MDLDNNWTNTELNTLMNWTNGSVAPECVEMMGGGNASDKYEPNVICLSHPEEMLNPAMRNPVFYQIIITHVITLVVGIFGNLIAVFVMIGEKKSRSATNLFLVSLACSDLALLLLCVPLEILQYFLQFDGNAVICKAAKYVLLLSASASVLNLCAVSLERFIVIVFPMRSRSLCTISNCRKAILMVWIFATILSLPVMFIKDGYTVVYTNYVVSVKVYYCENADENLPFAIYQFVILFAAPGVLMMICYFYVIRELWRSTMNINLLTNSRSLRGQEKRGKGKTKESETEEGTRAGGGGNNSTTTTTTTTTRFLKDKRSGVKPEPERKNKSLQIGTSQAHGTVRRSANNARINRGDDVKKARKQVIKMLILVIVLFLVCWGPKLIMTITLKMAETFGLAVYTPWVYNTRVIFSLIPFIHSSFNPVIYSFMSKNFRRSMSRQMARLGSLCGFNCIKASPARNDIPLRSAVNRTRKPLGPDSTSANYFPVSEAVSTRNTEIHEIHEISTI